MMMQIPPSISSVMAAPAAPSKIKLRANQTSGEVIMSQVATPVGLLSLAASKDGLQAAFFDTWWTKDPIELMETNDESADAIMRQAKQQIQEYFGGMRKDFTIPLTPKGTNFQKKAWAALEKIPYGKTLSYEEQASSMGEPGKARAVGAANGRNPICLFIPCHRVIAKGGGLCGYAFGLEAKKYLLDLETDSLPSADRLSYTSATKLATAA